MAMPRPGLLGGLLALAACGDDPIHHLVYEVPGRQRLAAAPAPAPALAPAVWPLARGVQHGVSPLLAALLTVCVPGAGHLYAGRILAAVMWFFLVGAGYALILPGLVLHVCSVISAASAARQVSGRGAPPRLVAAAI